MIPHLTVNHPINSGLDLITYLYANGHFHERDEDNFITQEADWLDIRDIDQNDPRVTKAIMSWQSMRPHLNPTGVFDAASANRVTIEQTQRCALPDIMPRQTATPAWPAECKHDITTKHELASLRYRPEPAQTISHAWKRGLELWNEQGNLTLSCCQGATDPRIVAKPEAMANYILAWSELATGTCASRLRQAYNSNVAWQWHLLWTTICHEIGHAIGIGHGGSGIMQPAHDPNIDELDQWDINQLVKRYGQPAPGPPTPTPADQPFHHATIELFDEQNRPIALWDITPRPVQRLLR